MYLVKVSQRRLIQDERFKIWVQQLRLCAGQDGIWRCQGRLQQSDLPETVNYPILLDKKHHFTKLIVMDCHARVLHNGVKQTITQLRTKYWIVKGRQFVRRLLNEYRSCKRFNARPFKGKSTPPLPEFRVRESPPFHSTGVDYAGPLYLRNGEKVWICLFTCCVAWAVHLELASDMTAAAFIRCLRQFSARRGILGRICSKNSKTFK